MLTRGYQETADPVISLYWSSDHHRVNPGFIRQHLVVVNNSCLRTKAPPYSLSLPGIKVAERHDIHAFERGEIPQKIRAPVTQPPALLR